jgi:succinate dehydrogenase / fumarate reductase, cytochrome b subunit
MPERPLSPHLSVYKFKYTLVTSILNRVAGLALSLGLLMLVYWLVTLAAGARAYAHARTILALGVCKLIYLCLIGAFVYHLLAGIRHLVWDCGIGLERASARRSAWLVMALSVLLTLILCCYLLGTGLRLR